MRLATAALLICSLTFPALSSAQEVKSIRHRVKKGDTLDLLAAEYYGSRDHAIFIMKVNGLTHKRPLKPGQRLRVPVSYEITTQVGDTLEGLAEAHLGDARRAPNLAIFNKLPVDASLAAGQVLTIPFHVTHKAERRVSLNEIAAAYYRNRRRASLLRAYNFLSKNTLDEGESVVIPIYHVRIQESKLPRRDARSRELIQKRRQEIEKAQNMLPHAKAAWRSGDYGAVRDGLSGIKTDFLDTGLAVEVGVLRGSAYVALSSENETLAIREFRQVLARAPDYTLDPFYYSPKIQSVWQKATESANP